MKRQMFATFRGDLSLLLALHLASCPVAARRRFGFTRFGFLSQRDLNDPINQSSPQGFREKKISVWKDCQMRATIGE